MSQRFLKVNSDCPQSADSCTSSDSSRREFLGHISAAALAALVGIELSASDASAVPLTIISGTQGAASEHTYPVPAADGVTIDREEEVILVRFHQQALAFNLACPHENTALRWRQEDSGSSARATARSTSRTARSSPDAPRGTWIASPIQRSGDN